MEGAWKKCVDVEVNGGGLIVYVYEKLRNGCLVVGDA